LLRRGVGEPKYPEPDTERWYPDPASVPPSPQDKPERKRKRKRKGPSKSLKRGLRGSRTLGPDSLEDPVVQGLLRDGVPVTRANYLEAAGLQEPLEPEVEAELPRELQKRNRM
jgi:hypothetical protein